MRIFVERPIATVMLFLAVAFLGAYSFLNIPLELAPKEDFPQITIQTGWSDVPPEIIQTQVTSPLEEVASTARGVKKITSTSSIGLSRIVVEFNPGTNMEFARLELMEKIARIRQELPYAANRPQIIPYVPEDFRTADFLHFTISGDYSLQELREMLKERFEYGLGAVKGVAGVEVSGGSDPEIRITLNREKTQSLNIHPYQVLMALNRWNQTFPAGRIQRGQQEYLFKISSSLASTRDLEELIIVHQGGVAVKLKDVAQVDRTYGEIRYLNRINGQPTIRLIIHKEKGTSTLKVARAVKSRLDDIKQEMPRNLIFRVVNDESEEILKSLRELFLLVGIILTVIFLLVFLILRSLKPSLLILSSIFFSVLITFNLIYFFKVSINMLTLGALALGFGLFVDNSIVVFENILRLREKGLSTAEAAVRGPKEVMLAVFASTLTTVSVFFCFPYFQGRLKIYYLPLGIVIASALSVSLLVSFSLIPALSQRLLQVKRAARPERVRKLYEGFVRFCLRHPLEILILVGVLFYGSYRWFKKEVTIGEFFRWYSQDRLTVWITMPPGTDLDRTDEVIRKFEALVMEKDYEKEMNSTISSENAYIQISFPPEVEFSFRPYALKEELIQLATQFAGLSVGISGFDPQGYYSSFGTGTFYDSYIKFFGYNLKKLKDITGELEQRLKQNPRVKETRIVSSRYGWWRVDSFEHILKIDREALRKYEIDPQYLYYHIQTLLRGEFSSPVRWRTEGKEIAISIKFPEADRLDLGALLDSLIRTTGGEYMRLGEISQLSEKPVAGSIDRENQQFQQTVMWEFRGPAKAAENYKKAVFASLKLPPGFSATLEETWRMTEEEKAQIKFAILFALVIIFMILSSLYESFVQAFFIILAVPLAMIGVFVAFVIADFSFDSSAYIGVILLGGIVVNNSILLVDHINLKRGQGLPLLEAVVIGARERVRPIFMTTGTTVLGMFPLLLIQAEVAKRKIWASLALSTVGGLISSTIFILIVIPIFYYYGDGIRLSARQKIAELGQARQRL
ncbi:MAG: efflux RND transporter permease subunit [Clostridiales bacterium]|nr:efflux RND transporter permease subunit [Clostridiales bacterium]